MKNNLKRVISLFITIAMIFVMIPATELHVHATEVTVLDGQVSIADSANSNTVSGGTVTITAKGSLFSKKTNNITITNNSGAKAQLSFDYFASTYNSFTIAGASVAASGSYSVQLEAGGTLSITLVSNNGLSNTTATLKLSNFGLTTVAAESNVTFNFDDSLGSVTVDGTAVGSGGVKIINGETGASLVATPANGATFLGWVDNAGNILSSTASFTYKPATDITIKPAFAKNDGTSTPWFGVGGVSTATFKNGLLNLTSNTYYKVSVAYLFDNLTDAVNKASSDASNKGIVLMNSGTLPAGTYTIPVGVKLLIPFDTANTMYTTCAEAVQTLTSNSTYTTVTKYRELTMADGAHLIINGEMSLPVSIILHKALSIAVVRPPEQLPL